MAIRAHIAWHGRRLHSCSILRLGNGRNLLGEPVISDEIWLRADIRTQAILVLSGLVVSSPVSRSPWLWRGAGALIVVFFLTLNITLWTQAEMIR